MPRGTVHRCSDCKQGRVVCIYVWYRYTWGHEERMYICMTRRRVSENGRCMYVFMNDGFTSSESQDKEKLRHGTVLKSTRKTVHLRDNNLIKDSEIE